MSNFNNIPEELRQLNQWCLAGKNKQPLKPDGSSASVTDSNTWSSFDAVCKAAEAKGLGIGFVLSKADPFTCIDLDVKDSESRDKEGNPYRKEELTKRDEAAFFSSTSQVANSYAELSTRGKGIHIWVKGTVPNDSKKRGKGIEVYSQERFIICTGNPVSEVEYTCNTDSGVISANVVKNDIKPIEEQQSVIDNLLTHIKASTGSTAESIPLEELPDTETDDAIWERARVAGNAEKFNDLCNGEYAKYKYPSQSEADAALMQMIAFYTVSNEQCKRMFRQTELGKREKATKDDRYLNLTLVQARSQLAKDKQKDAEYSAHGAEVVKTMKVGMQGKNGRFTISEWRTILDYEKGQNSKSLTTGNEKRVIIGEPKNIKVEYLDDPYIVKNAVIGFYGNGEAGKSSLVATVCGQNACTYSTLWCTSEEAPDFIQRRHMGIGAPYDTIAVVNKVKCIVTELPELIKEARIGLSKPLGFIVLDAVVTMASFTKGKDENDNKTVKEFIEKLENIAIENGVSILMIGHCNKSKNHTVSAHKVMGSIAWTSSPRVSYLLESDKENEFYGHIEVIKGNRIKKFGQAYKTIPVWYSEPNIDGEKNVLCKAEFLGIRTYGEKNIRREFGTEEELSKIENKQSKYEQDALRILQRLQDGKEHTRKDFEDKGTIHRSAWNSIDELLKTKGVIISCDPGKAAVYKNPNPEGLPWEVNI
ncbi:MAG: AAA family ATPase [Thiolinea sp.]